MNSTGRNSRPDRASDETSNGVMRQRSRAAKAVRAAALAAAMIGAIGVAAPAVGAAPTPPSVPSVTVTPSALPAAVPPPPSIRLSGRYIVDGSKRIRIRSTRFLRQPQNTVLMVGHERSGRGYILDDTTNTYSYLLRVGPRGGIRVLQSDGKYGSYDRPRLVDNGNQILTNVSVGAKSGVELLNAYTGAVIAKRVFPGTAFYDSLGRGPGLSVQIDDLGSWVDVWHPETNTLHRVIGGVSLAMTSIGADRLAYQAKGSGGCDIIATYENPTTPVATYCGGDYIAGFTPGGGRMLTYPNAQYQQESSVSYPKTMTLRSLSGAPVLVYRAHAFAQGGDGTAGGPITGTGARVFQASSTGSSATVRCRQAACTRISKLTQPF